jgi:hypothetical protein
MPTMRNICPNDENISPPSSSPLESKKPEQKSDEPEMKANFAGQKGSPGDWVFQIRRRRCEGAGGERRGEGMGWRMRKRDNVRRRMGTLI